MSEKKWIIPIVVAMLLAGHWVLAVTAVADKSATFDEGFHLTAGYSYWLADDFRLDPESGFMAQRIMALPLLGGGYKFPGFDQPAWRASHLPILSQQFFYESGNDPDAMLLRARMMVALLSVALGAIVFYWSRRLFGPAGGLVSLALYAFSPVMLSNGALATIDLTAALGFMLCLTCFWAMLRRLTIWNLAASCGAAAFLLLAKMSAVLVLPMLLVVLAVQLVSARPIEISLPGLRRQIAGRLARAGVMAGIVAIHIIIVAALIWGFFGFRYSAFASGSAGGNSFYNTRMVDDATGPIADAAAFARRHRLLPEAYLYGFAYAMSGAQSHSAYLNGQYSENGWPEFFPYVFAVKTPLATFAILLLAAAAGWCSWRSPAEGENAPAGWKKNAKGAFYSTSPLWVLLAIYWSAAIASHINVGVRHILPTYAPMYVLAGAAGWWAAKGAKGMKIILAGLIAFAAAECAWIWPDYLAYFNIIAGGPRNAYKHIVDSSLDWGQDLPGLKKYLDRAAQTGNENVYLSYFGTSSPKYYGIAARRLPGYFDMDAISDYADIRPLSGGTYCISATCLMQALTNGGIFAPWSQKYESLYQKSSASLGPLLRSGPDEQRRMLQQPQIAEAWRAYSILRFGRLCAFLRARPCDDQVGHSILIFRLTDEDIGKALTAPPPELTQ